MIRHYFVVAAAITLSAAALADTTRRSVLENFDRNTHPASLVESGGSPEYLDGAVTFRGWQQRYLNGAFTPTATVGLIVATDTFGRNNTRLFVGGSGVYDDLAIVAVGAKKHGGECAAQGLPRWGRNAAHTDADSFGEAVVQLCEMLRGEQ